MSILLDSSILLSEDIANSSVRHVSIFPIGYVSIIAGEPGIGKTWLMLSIAKSLAEGRVGVGSPVDRYPKGKCLIFAGETGVRLLANRVKLMGGINPLSSCRVISSHQCARLSIDTMINSAIGRQNIEDAIADYKPNIVFFDTMISFMGDGKDESSQADMSDTIRMLSNIAMAHDTAMVLIHHFRKRTSANSTSRGLDEVIGTSAFTRLASVVIGVERSGELRVVRCLKSWWEEFNPFAFVISKDDKGVIYLKQDYNYSRDGSYSAFRGKGLYARKIKEDFVNKEFTALDLCSRYEVSRSYAGELVSFMLQKGDISLSRMVGNTKMYSLGGSKQCALNLS